MLLCNQAQVRKLFIGHTLTTRSAPMGLILESGLVDWTCLTQSRVLGPAAGATLSEEALFEIAVSEKPSTVLTSDRPATCTRVPRKPMSICWGSLNLNSSKSTRSEPPECAQSHS